MPRRTISSDTRNTIRNATGVFAILSVGLFAAIPGFLALASSSGHETAAVEGNHIWCTSFSMEKGDKLQYFVQVVSPRDHKTQVTLRTPSSSSYKNQESDKWRLPKSNSDEPWHVSEEHTAEKAGMYSICAEQSSSVANVFMVVEWSIDSEGPEDDFFPDFPWAPGTATFVVASLLGITVLGTKSS